MKQILLICVFLGAVLADYGHHEFNHRYHLRHYHGGYWRLAGYRMLCSPDECVPTSVKESIRQGWTETGRNLWNQCVPENTCELEDVRQIVHCMYGRLIHNTTDVTIKEYRQTFHTLSVKGVVECCEDQITLKMLMCSRPHHNASSFEHERAMRRHYYRDMRRLNHGGPRFHQERQRHHFEQNGSDEPQRPHSYSDHSRQHDQSMREETHYEQRSFPHHRHPQIHNRYD